jgi:hypothetical protein
LADAVRSVVPPEVDDEPELDDDGAVGSTVAPTVTGRLPWRPPGAVVFSSGLSTWTN